LEWREEGCAEEQPRAGEGGCYVMALRQRPQLARMAGDQALGATQEIQKNLKRRLGVPLTNGITETELWLFQTMHFSLVSTFKLFWETQGVKGARVQSLQRSSELQWLFVIVTAPFFGYIYIYSFHF
jgi:hypothetical protein